MKKQQKSKKVWAFQPQTLKFDTKSKEKILSEVLAIIKEKDKLSKKVHRTEMRGHRVYLYELYEPMKIEGVIFTQPLIEGKYFEVAYARITLEDIRGEKCNADWQRHNNQWMTIYTGTLKECLEYIEEDNGWF